MVLNFVSYNQVDKKDVAAYIEYGEHMGVKGAHFVLYDGQRKIVLASLSIDSKFFLPQIEINAANAFKIPLADDYRALFFIPPAEINNEIPKEDK